MDNLLLTSLFLIVFICVAVVIESINNYLLKKKYNEIKAIHRQHYGD